MAKKILINKKTGKEFATKDADAVLEKYPKTFRVKPATQLNSDILEAEGSILQLNLTDLEKHLNKIENIQKLDDLLKKETSLKNRSGAIQLIEDRKKVLISNLDVNASEEE